MREAFERQGTEFQERREEESRRLAEVISIASRKELNGEPNVEGMKMCAFCENPVQYQWTTKGRTGTYCSEYCRRKAAEKSKKEG